MFFGLTNLPATFQAMMNELFCDLISTGKVVIYLNNILIFTEDLNEHRKLVCQVLEIFRSNNLSLKIEKCEFEKTQVKYLGLIIRDGETRMDPAKVSGVANWPEPENKKELQSFLGFCNYYCRFIKDFSEIAHPLHDLIKWMFRLIGGYNSNICSKHLRLPLFPTLSSPFYMIMPLGASSQIVQTTH
jgi:hypothetical protein